MVTSSFMRRGNFVHASEALLPSKSSINFLLYNSVFFHLGEESVAVFLTYFYYKLDSIWPQFSNGKSPAKGGLFSPQLLFITLEISKAAVFKKWSPCASFAFCGM